MYVCVDAYRYHQCYIAMLIILSTLYSIICFVTDRILLRGKNNKSKRSEFVTRELKTFTGVFETIKALKLKLIDEMDTLVPPTLDFQLGYFSGKQSEKHWLIEEGDHKEMYAKD
jgi:hypothetical protein